jgi:hypothetical protein
VRCQAHGTKHHVHEPLMPISWPQCVLGLERTGLSDMSVGSHHTGAAFGLNSAVARTGGLVATTLIGAVLASTGPTLLSAFDVAAMVGAGLCVAASLSALSLIAQNAPGN